MSDINEYQLSGATHSVYALTDELRRLGHEVKLLLLSTDRRSHRQGDSYYIASLLEIIKIVETKTDK